MPDSQIIIVGGGPAGLTTAGALKQAGLDTVILDSGERVGQSWERRYERLHLHTVREYSGLAHFPIPRSYPRYPSKDQYAAYLREYAAHFELNFIPQTQVTRVRQAQVDGQSGWAVDTAAGSRQAQVVVMATGQYQQPVCPSWPGLAGYTGEQMHSSDYQSGRVFRGKRVLVIGAGNSGLEIAADLVEQGAQGVAVSMRTAPPVVPRDFLGSPAQVFGILMYRLPPALSDRIGQAFARLALGDLRKYGLPAPGWGAFASMRTPLIDVGFVAALKAGKVVVCPQVRDFTPAGVVFVDGREEAFDAVIMATGFRSGLEQLLEPQGLLQADGSPRFAPGAPTDCPGLYFMGYFNSLRGYLYESNLASQRLAGHIRRELGATG